MAEYSDDLAGTRQAIKALAKNVGTALAAVGNGGQGGGAGMPSSTYDFAAYYSSLVDGTPPPDEPPPPTVSQLAYSTAVLADAPTYYWPMQDRVGTTNIAESVAGKVGTTTAVVDYADNSLKYPPAALGRSYYYANQADNVAGASADGLSVSGAVTLEIWAKGEQWTGWNTSMINLDGQLIVGHGQNDGQWIGQLGSNIISWSTTATDFAWHHLALTVSATGDAVLYVDGIQRAGGQLGAPGSYTKAYFGSTTVGNWLVGHLTQAAIYSKVLTAAQVKAHYDAGVAPADPVWHGPDERYDPTVAFAGFSNVSALTDRTLVPVYDFLSDMTSSNVAAHAAIVHGGAPYRGMDGWSDTDNAALQGAMSNIQGIMRANGMTGFIRAEELARGATYGSETVGGFVIDEPDMKNEWDEMLAAGARIPTGMLGYINHGVGTTMSKAQGGRTPQQWANQLADKVHLRSHDTYWYSAPPVLFEEAGDPIYWGYSRSQIRRAVNYGRTMERLNWHVRSNALLWGVVELAHPNNTFDCSGPNPLQVEGAAWASIIGGARGILWFHHNFYPTDASGTLVQAPAWSATTDYSASPCVVQHKGIWYYSALPPAVGEEPVETSYTWVKAMPESGAGIDRADVRHPDLIPMLKKIRADLQTAAPAIYAKTIGHFLHKDLYSTYRIGLDGKKWIIAVPDLGAPNGGTFTMRLPSGQSPTAIEVVGEGRTITPSGGTFVDTFAAEYTHHIYRWS